MASVIVGAAVSLLMVLVNWVAALPAEWLAALKQAAEETDVEALFEVIEQIRERDAAVADALARLAEDFEYDEILALIQLNVLKE